MKNEDKTAFTHSVPYESKEVDVDATHYSNQWPNVTDKFENVFAKLKDRSHTSTIFHVNVKINEPLT